MTTILAAPDAFKGSATAKQVCQAIAAGVSQADQSMQVYQLPFADGGEGTVVSLVEATGGKMHTAVVSDALGREVTGSYGVIGNGRTAVVELASVSGIERLAAEELDPYTTSSYGTGQLVKAAIAEGVESVIICLGGSATNDAGFGLLQALGYRFLDNTGEVLPQGGYALQWLSEIDDRGVSEDVHNVQFQIACDVDNPFIGPDGASVVFGPQKGATPDQVQVLDDALTNVAAVIQQQYRQDIRHLTGAGAAGGAAGGLYALLEADLKSGFQIVAETLQLTNLLRAEAIDLIMTGEGQIDGQTEAGKVVAGIAAEAQRYNIPVIALAGSVTGDVTALYENGLTAVFSIVNQPQTLQEAMQATPALVAETVNQVLRIYSLSTST